MTSLPHPPAFYEFGPFRLSVEKRLLLRDGVAVPLFPKAFDILVILVENRDRLVTKEELLRRVWPDTFVQESNLSQNIHVLRKALGSGDDDQTFIETVPRQGYRFTGSVLPLESEVVVTKRSLTQVVLEEVTEDAPPRREQRHTVAIGSISVALLAVATVMILGRFTARSQRPQIAPVAPPAMPRLERLTTDSTSYEPAISPDGRFVAYRVGSSGQQTVWLRNIATGSAVQVLPPNDAGYSSVNFSRDGNELLYKTFNRKSDIGTVVRVPLFGGAPQQVARDVWGDFSLSPDGQEIAFVRANNALEHQLMAVNIFSGQERVVTKMADQQLWLEAGNTSPSWSPDGQRLVVCGGWRDPERGLTFGVFEVPASGGQLQRLSSPPWNRLNQVAWLDASALVVVGKKEQREPYQVWLLNYPSGPARRLTNDLADYNKLRVSADARVIAVEQQIEFHHLWVTTPGDSASATQISQGARSMDGFYGLTWTPDGRILFTSSRTGESEIYTANPDGSDLRQLTRDSREWNTNPRMTRDGRTIVFSSGRSGDANIWRMDSDGSNVEQLTRGKSEFSPALSPDGQWVYYINAHVTPARIERVAIGGGPAQVVFEGEAAAVPVISPDGQWLAFNLYSERTGFQAAVMPVAGGKRRLFDWHGLRGFIRWSADSQGLMFMKQQGNASNVWIQPLDGSEPRAVTNFKDLFIWNFAPSPNGKQLALSRGSSVSEIVLLRDFR